MAKDIIVSRKRIAEQLGCSVKTVSRMFAAGRLPAAWKIGGRPAPIKITKKALEKAKRGRGKG